MELLQMISKTENISLSRQAFAVQHGTFLRSEGKCLPNYFFFKNIHLYNIINIVVN